MREKPRPAREKWTPERVNMQANLYLHLLPFKFFKFLNFKKLYFNMYVWNIFKTVAD
jgi:hypothetical protein